MDEEQPEKLAARLNQVREGAVPHVEEGQRLPEPQPILVSQVPVAVETTPVPVPASAPVAAEAHSAEVATPGESPQSEESFEWVNRIGLELLAPQPKPHRAWRIPLAVGLVAGLILIAGLLYSGILQRFLTSGALRQTSTLASTSPEPDSSASLNAGGTASSRSPLIPLPMPRRWWNRGATTRAARIGRKPNRHFALHSKPVPPTATPRSAFPMCCIRNKSTKKAPPS